MAFRRGNSFNSFSHYEDQELEEVGEGQKGPNQYFGFGQKGRGGLQRQNQGSFNRGQLGGGRRESRDDLPGRGLAPGLAQRVKPGKEIYRPPAPGGSWNIEAQEFKPLAPAPLTSSRSVDFTGDRAGVTVTLRHSDNRSGPGNGNIELDMGKLMGIFGKEMEEVIRQILEDPNRLSARSHMELVRQIFTKVVESQRISELAAQFCIYIIERERKETFLESLLNTCQEWYHERDRIIRAENKSDRWAAFMSFLNELYGLLKRKQVQLESKYEGVAPCLVLLGLLAECCTVTTAQTQALTLQETEVLFLVLTHIQRDLMTEAPGQMTLIVNCLREAFLMSEAPQQVRKTLLQLLELQSAGWQLPAEAVMYYYPGAKL